MRTFPPLRRHARRAPRPTPHARSRTLSSTTVALAVATVLAVPGPAAGVGSGTSAPLPSPAPGSLLLDLPGLPDVPGLPQLIEVSDPNDVELEDILAALPGLVAGLVENRTDMARCPELAGGTVGFPEIDGEPGRDGVDEGNPLTAGDASEGPDALPHRVDLRSETQTFNRRYEFVLLDGEVYYRSRAEVTGLQEPWAHLQVPDCFAGEVVGISVDDDELIAVDRDRWVYVMDGALREPAYFSWSMRFGRPFWLGAGRTLPENKDWEWSVISVLEDETWRDDAGNEHRVGSNKVSHIWMLDDSGTELTYMDPWLPPDESYRACGPERGRFRAQSLSASGSTLFVVGPRGDLFTRLYDFDISGADPLFFDYSYEDQSEATEPLIQLPSPAWVEQPKIRGFITDRISVHKTGAGSSQRELRVEGRHRGRTGFWTKSIHAQRWRFRATQELLVGDRLRNPHRDTSRRGLAPATKRRYGGIVAGVQVHVPDFDVYCTPAQLRVRLADGSRLRLRLHGVDNIRQVERSPGLDDEPRMIRGTIEVPPGQRRAATAAGKKFLDSIGPDRFTDAPLDVTWHSMEFRDQGWLLRHG